MAILLLFLVLIWAFYPEIVFGGRTLLPIAPRVLGSTQAAWGAPSDSTTDLYRVDAGASAWQNEPQTRIAAAEYAS
ncbi:MAG TPA: hypothetical protein VGK33_22915, partial [Chloroflexota bacterium]